jgi:hypothetical protein
MNCGTRMVFCPCGKLSQGLACTRTQCSGQARTGESAGIALLKAKSL